MATLESHSSNSAEAEKRQIPSDAQFVTKSGVIITEDGVIYKNSDVAGDDSDEEATGEKLSHVFKDPEVAQYYRNVYEKSNYECRHRFDPDFEWTPEEEKKILWRLEYKVCLWACIMFMALQIDRGNLQQALADNMLDDLGLTTNDYNRGQTIFYLTFLSAELPSQLISKKIGPDRWIPLQITLWSIVAISQAKLSGRGSYFATRALLGLLEGGFIPDVVLWLSYFYTGSELPVRLSYFWTSLSITTIVTSLLAFGLLRMRGIGGWAGWQWLFLIEGLITLLIGISAFFLMPASPVQTKARWRPNGWFTEREEKIVVNRILRDDPSKGDMHNRQPITFKLLWYSISDYDLWPLYIIGLCAYIPLNTPSSYMTLTLRQLGFSAFNTNLLTIPSNVIHIIFMLILTWLTEKVNERSLLSLFQPFWLIVPLGVLRWWSGSLKDVWGTYAVLVILLSAPYIHAILVGWCSKNSNTVRSRTVSASLYNMFVQAGSIISSNIYRKDDAPLYHRGNTQLFAIAWASVGVILFAKAYYMWRNKRRDTIWNAMTDEEKISYRFNTKDRGNKRLDFRFAH